MRKITKERREKGITLIALVVTIVVLLILAGVSINLVIGNNGIITKAGDAKDATEQATVNDQIAMNSLYDELAGFLNGSNSGNGEGYGENQLPSTDYTTPYLPTGFSKVDGTDLDTGLVIQDSVGNQYVWVEVPKTEAVYPTAGLGITTFDETAYARIEADLHTYTRTYRNGTSYTDTYCADTDNAGWFTESEYNTAKNNMLKSVYENGGFYVGRYETGIATTQSPRTASGATTGYTPVIKANAYPYNYVTRTQAQSLASNMDSGDRTSSLMFGVQWDLVLKYLEMKAVEKGATLDTIQEELNGTTTGSTNWGNCGDSEFDITNINAKYVIYHAGSETMGNWEVVPVNYTKPRSYENEDDFVLLTTGANETRNSKQNICDLAGNVLEWTLEYTTTTSLPCTSRGGNYYYSGHDKQASVRLSYSTTNSSDFWGFRVSIY